MGRRGRSFNGRRDDVYQFLIEIAETRNGSLPTKYGCWQRYRESPEYPHVNWTRFRVLFDELVRDGRVKDDNGIIFICEAEWKLKRKPMMQLSF